MVKNKCASPGEYSRKFYTGEALLLTLLYKIFDTEGTPFVYLILPNGAPSTDLVWNYPSHLTANPLSFEYE